MPDAGWPGPERDEDTTPDTPDVPWEADEGDAWRAEQRPDDWTEEGEGWKPQAWPEHLAGPEYDLYKKQRDEEAESDSG